VSALGWVYFLLLLSLAPATTGFVQFMRSFQCPPQNAVHRLRLAFLFTMISLVLLSVAGAVMWDAAGWPITAP
jgi:cytochrome b subunit of formate dehydrogenase